MKPLLTALLACVLFSCQDISKENNSTESFSVIRRDLYIRDMHYVLFTQTDKGVSVINLTKDSLEVEALKRKP